MLKTAIADEIIAITTTSSTFAAERKRSLTVSSVQMEWIWVPNITEVKMRKRRPSKHRRMRSMTVAGGEKELHSGVRKGDGTHTHGLNTQIHN